MKASAVLPLLTLLLTFCSIPLASINPATASSSRSVFKSAGAAKIYHDRGIAKYQSGDRQGAIRDFNFPKGTLRERAIKLDPRYARAYLDRGVAKFGLGDKQGAIADYSQAILLQNRFATALRDPLIYYNRGVAKFELGNNQGAIADFDLVIEIDPQDAETYCNRGAVKLAIGDKQGASPI